MSGHALRLTTARLHALAQYQRAGTSGLPLVYARWPDLFAASGLVEIYEDDSRIFTARARITDSGRRVAAALCERKEVSI